MLTKMVLRLSKKQTVISGNSYDEKKRKENNFAFIDSQNLNLGVRAQITRFVADIKNKVQKKKDPDKDETSSGHYFRS